MGKDGEGVSVTPLRGGYIPHTPYNMYSFSCDRDLYPPCKVFDITSNYRVDSQPSCGRM